MRGRLLGGALAAAALILAAAGSGTCREWRPAEGAREWVFPRDHGAHPDHRTEWWYFTAVLEDPGGGRWGCQLTFFRQGLRPDLPPGAGAWAVRDVFLAHLAVTDVAGGRFTWAERVSRTGPGLAGAEEASLGVRLLSWSAREEGGRFVLDAADGPLSLHLVLTPGASPPVLHGPGGLSRKGDKPGQASWYYSLPDLAAEGRLGVPWVGEPIPVRGQVWFDHEFGSNQMAPDQTGWDWFGLRLDDGRKLMLYLIRRSDGTVEPASGGTLVEADGRTRPLGSGDFLVRVLDRWLSPRSGGRYPSRWRITLAGEGLELEVRPALTDQELSTDHSTGVTYWEGVVEARGSRRGAPVRGEGYAELTGYAGRLGGLF